MADKKEHWIKSKWMLAIFSAVLGPMIYDLFKQQHVLSSLRSVLIWTFESVKYLLTFDLKVWWVLLVLVAVFFWLNLYINRLNRRIKGGVRDYIEDQINGRRWT